MTQHTDHDGRACEVALGHSPQDRADDRADDLADDLADDRADDRRMVVAYASPLALHLLSWGRELGFTTVLVEPDATRVTAEHRAAADAVSHASGDVEVSARTDVVISDHHREDLGAVMAPLVTAGPRWVGIIGSPRHAGPHEAALTAEGVARSAIATVHRPIGVDIGSRTPAEIALSILAGLLADRNGRRGGLPRSAQARTAD